jgi:hypothetical protein
LINLEHYFSFHHDDETFHNPQRSSKWKTQICGWLFRRVERCTHNAISMWKIEIPIVSKAEKSEKMHKSIKKHVIKWNDKGWKGGARLHNVWALHEMNDGIKGS